MGGVMREVGADLKVVTGLDPETGTTDRLLSPVLRPGGEQRMVARRLSRGCAGEPWAPAGVQGLWVSAKGAVDDDLVQGARKQGELLIVELGDEQL